MSNGMRQSGGMGRQRRGKPPDACKCPQCGYESDKIRGVPCRDMKCPKCGSVMLGK